jgi:nucleoside-diphosphate-sugar epimerase
MIFIIGGNGFIGSAFARLLKTQKVPYEIITRENFSKYRGASCDVLINANGNSKKYMADQDPVREFNLSVVSVLESLTSFKYKKYIYLSTGDVYPSQNDPEKTSENLDIDIKKQSQYGLHKYLAEQLVQRYAKDWLIFRMGGFVGPGLRKNAIFDMCTNAPLWISPKSKLQFISTDFAAKIMIDLSQRPIENEIINIGGMGVVELSKVYKELGSRSLVMDGAQEIRFELSLRKLQEIYAKPIPSSLDEVRQYYAMQPKLNGKV